MYLLTQKIKYDTFSVDETVLDFIRLHSASIFYRNVRCIIVRPSVSHWGSIRNLFTFGGFGSTIGVSELVKSRNKSIVFRSLNTDMIFGYEESMDYSKLPGFDDLNEEQQQHVREEYERGYRSVVNTLGIKMAVGRGHQTAKVALDEAQLQIFLKPQPVPPSIFEGLENCQ